MMIRPLFALCCALCVSGGTAAAAPSPPAPPIASVPNANPASLAAAHRLLDAMGYEDLMRRTTQSMVAPMKADIKRRLEEKLERPVDDSLIVELSAVADRFMKARLVDEPKLRSATALLYARHYSAADLDHMAVLYRDPVMQRFNRQLPALMAEFMPLITGMLDQHRGTLELEMTTVIRDYLEKLPEAKSGS